jgi:hypothetical protein
VHRAHSLATFGGISSQLWGKTLTETDFPAQEISGEIWLGQTPWCRSLRRQRLPVLATPEVPLIFLHMERIGQ